MPNLFAVHQFVPRRLADEVPVQVVTAFLDTIDHSARINSALPVSVWTFEVIQPAMVLVDDRPELVFPEFDGMPAPDGVMMLATCEAEMTEPDPARQGYQIFGGIWS